MVISLGPFGRKTRGGGCLARLVSLALYDCRPSIVPEAHKPTNKDERQRRKGEDGQRDGSLRVCTQIKARMTNQGERKAKYSRKPRGSRMPKTQRGEYHCTPVDGIECTDDDKPEEPCVKVVGKPGWSHEQRGNQPGTIWQEDPDQEDERTGALHRQRQIRLT